MSQEASSLERGMRMWGLALQQGQCVGHTGQTLAERCPESSEPTECRGGVRSRSDSENCVLRPSPLEVAQLFGGSLSVTQMGKSLRTVLYSAPASWPQPVAR